MYFVAREMDFAMFILPVIPIIGAVASALVEWRDDTEAEDDNTGSAQ